MSKPKDASAATLTPAGLTSNVSTFSITGLSAGLWTVTDTITDSAGAVRKTHMYIRHTAEAQPSSAHNTIPTVSAVNHILPVGSTSTRLYVVPRDPEGIAGYSSPATGYTQGELGAAEYLVTALTHSWSQIGGPATATITNGTTIRPDVTGLTQSGTYTFRYTGTDQQSDTVTVDVTVTTEAGEQQEAARMRLIAIAMSIVMAFATIPLMLILARSRSVRLTLSPPRFSRYQSVIGPDRRKRLRAGIQSTFEPRTRVVDFIKTKK